MSNEFKSTLINSAEARYPFLANLSDDQIGHLINANLGYDPPKDPESMHLLLDTLASEYEESEEHESDNYDFDHNSSFVNLLFWTGSGVGWAAASSVPIGWILIVVLSIMVFFSLPFIRRNGHFFV